MPAFIFDLNGIFIQSPLLSERFAAEFNVPTSEFLPALKEVLYYSRRSKTGGSFKLWQPYLKKWGVDLNEKQFFDFWFKAETANQEMIDLAKELKTQGTKVFILSNNFFERAQYYRQTFPELEKIFDKIYYSWETGFVKPDKRAYKHLLTENNLSAQDCFYFDNSQENVDAAKELGMKAYLFESTQETKKIIESNI